MSHFLLSVTVVLISVGQIEQKLAARELRTGVGLRAAFASLAGSSHFWFALMAMGAGLASWLAALAELDVSLAYPMLGFSFVLTSVLSALFLGEHVSRSRWIGAGLISLGVAVMVSG